jgi:hypothetical protein
MTKATVSAAGGAMPRTQISRTNLIDEATGEVNRWVLKGLARKEAMATYGAIAGAFQVRNRAAGTAFYGSQSLLGASRCKSIAPISWGRTAMFSRAWTCGAMMKTKQLA